MAELIIPVGYAKLNYVLTGVGLNNAAQVTMGVNPPDSMSASDIADAAWTAYSDNILPDINDDIGLTELIVKKGPNNTGEYFVKTGNVAGGATGTGVSPAVSMLIQKRSASGGRANRGRVFQPGVPSTAQNFQGEILSANLTTFQTDWDNYLADMNTALLPVVLLHTEVGLTPTAVTAFVVQGTLATQRRRQRP